MHELDLQASCVVGVSVKSSYPKGGFVCAVAVDSQVQLSIDYPPFCIHLPIIYAVLLRSHDDFLMHIRGALETGTNPDIH